MFEPYADRKAWAKQQVEAAQVPEATARTILSVFHTWLNMMPSDTEECEQAMRCVNQLVTGQSIRYERKNEVPEMWQHVRPGNIKRGDYVRVLGDAYGGDAGMWHNGRRGPVIRVSNGDVVVKYDDELTPDFGLMGSHHSPHKLEKRVS